MNNAEAQIYLLSKPETKLDFPFGEGVEVYKVKDKMFATLSLGTGNEKDTNGKLKDHYSMNLKCDPDEAVILRDIFPSIIPAYHMNKRLWITVILDGSIPQGELERLIDNSFLLVVQKMTKKDRTSIELHL